MQAPDYRSFYDERRHQTYGQAFSEQEPEQASYYRELKSFVEEYSLEDKKCLEIGSSGGAFQDMVEDYYGTDIAESLARYYHKPYRVTRDTRYPFDDAMFDAIWTITVFEHIPHLQPALLEIKRLLKPGGLLLFAPAWQCRSWAADGYAVRPYQDFNWKGKLYKASIPVRDSVVWRALHVLPKRLCRHARFWMGYRFDRIRYKNIRPNYDKLWTSDSDACNHIDPHDAILWFESNGFKCISHPLHLSALKVRTGALIFRKT